MDLPQASRVNGSRSTGERIQEVLETTKHLLQAGERFVQDLKGLQRQTERFLDSTAKFTGNPYAIFGAAIGGSLLLSFLLRSREKH